MSEERDRIVLRYRDLLRASFDDETFTRFDNFVKKRDSPENFAPPVKVPLPPTQPEARKPRR